MAPTFRIELQLSARVSGRCLASADWLILCDPQCPGHLAAAPDLTGMLYRVPPRAQELQVVLDALARQGFSRRGRSLLTELHRRGVRFAWFEADDGPTVDRNGSSA